MGIFKHSLDMISLPLTVPAGTEAGDVVRIGANVVGVAITDRYVVADYAKGGSKYPSTPPQGLSAGQATVCLPDIRAVLEITATGTIAAGDTVYEVLSGSGVGNFTSDHTAGTTRGVVGVALEAMTNGNKGMLGVTIPATAAQ